MDTTENELQALRKEIGNLYTEVTTLRRELAESVKFINGCINGQYLPNYLVRLTGMQTAEFIIRNMNKVKSFANKRRYMQYVLGQTVNFGGGYLEFGVYSGGTINQISAAKPDKIVYGFDSFEGLPETWRSGFDKGYFDTKENLPKVNENVRLIKGWFDETLPSFVKAHPEKCEFIHVDCDLYSSTKRSLRNLENTLFPARLSPLTNISIILAGRRANIKLSWNLSKKIIWSLNISPAPTKSRLRLR